MREEFGYYTNEYFETNVTHTRTFYILLNGHKFTLAYHQTVALTIQHCLRVELQQRPIGTAGLILAMVTVR